MSPPGRAGASHYQGKEYAMRRTAAVCAALAALAVAVITAACGSGGGHHSTAASTSTAAPAVSTSPSRPAGCGQVLVVVGTVRGELENAPDE